MGKMMILSWGKCAKEIFRGRTKECCDSRRRQKDLQKSPTSSEKGVGLVEIAPVEVAFQRDKYCKMYFYEEETRHSLKELARDTLMRNDQKVQKD
jgi:hypothetical protein